MILEEIELQDQTLTELERLQLRVVELENLEADCKHDRKAVYEQRERIRSVIASIDASIFILDIDGVFLDYFQPEDRLDLMVPPDRFLGRSIKNVIPAIAGLSHAVDAALSTRETQQFDYALNSMDGEQWYTARISPWQNSANQFAGVVVVVRNITKRMEAKKALRRRTERLRALAMQLAEVQETERQQLARELHDRIGQNLTALSINLNIIRTQAPEALAPTIQKRLDDSLLLVEQTTVQVRDVMADLRPPMLDDYGLVPALHWYGEQFSQRTGIAVTVVGKSSGVRCSLRVENALFRIAQEALTNVARHAEATQVTISVVGDNESIRLVVADDGVGFDVAAVAESGTGDGWGLLTMSERAESVNGSCHIESTPDLGSQVIIEIKR